MKKINLAILLFLVSVLLGMFQSCGPLMPDNKPTCCMRPTAPSDPTFKPYVDEFLYYQQKKSTSIPVYFADLEPGIAGVCHYFRVGSGPIRWGYIEIDKEYWGYISEFQKINLIFHELGHCVLGRDHVPWGNSVMMCPQSMMYDTVLSTQCMEDNYQAYLEEMFPNFPWSTNGQ
jgi:hypothetical protein